MRRRWLASVLVAVLGCVDKGDAAASAASISVAGASATQAGDTRASAAKASADAKAGAKNGATEGAAKASDARPTDLCKSFDKDGVARALGWSGLHKTSGVGSSANGLTTRTCGYEAEGTDAGGSFGVTFSTAAQFDGRHAGYGVTFEPRAQIDGHEARVAKNDRVVVLQIQLPTMMLVVDASVGGKAPADLEAKLEAAANALVASLPADARTRLDARAAGPG